MTLLMPSDWSMGERQYKEVRLFNMPDAVMLHWEYRKQERNTANHWFLVESYGADFANVSTSPVKSGRIRESEWDHWHWRFNKTQGTAVTKWTVSRGVVLVSLSLNNEEVPSAQWLADSATKQILNLLNWSDILAGGFVLRHGTVEEVQRLMSAGWDFTPPCGQPWIADETKRNSNT